jgi:hypothetical protein
MPATDAAHSAAWFAAAHTLELVDDGAAVDYFEPCNLLFDDSIAAASSA